MYGFGSGWNQSPHDISDLSVFGPVWTIHLQCVRRNKDVLVKADVHRLTSLILRMGVWKNPDRTRTRASERTEIVLESGGAICGSRDTVSTTRNGLRSLTPSSLHLSA